MHVSTKESKKVNALPRRHISHVVDASAYIRVNCSQVAGKSSSTMFLLHLLLIQPPYTPKVEDTYSRLAFRGTIKNTLHCFCLECCKSEKRIHFLKNWVVIL